MSEQTFRQGEILFQRGDPSDIAYFIRSGQVEVLDERAGHEIRVAMLTGGDIVGEMGLIEERPRSLTARALTEVRTSAVTRDAFVDLILHHPEEGLAYLRALFERLRTMNVRALAAGRDSPREMHSPESFEVTLAPLTEKAARTVPAPGLRLPRSPFRIGRALDSTEASLDRNDLTLPDSPPYHVSRNHFSIEIRSDGVLIRDRGSYLGTIVNGTHIGGRHHSGSALLATGDNEVIAGSTHSPYRFRVTVASRP